MNKIEIYTDGSSKGNPGPGGWAFIAIYPNSTGEIRVDEKGGHENDTTNNRMEMMAVMESLKFFESYYDKHVQVEYLIRLDSAYVLNGATKWVYGWMAKNWKTADGGDVKNIDLWKKMHEIIQGKKIVWKLLPGHSNIYGNERCDEIATGFADNNPPVLYSGFLAEYPGSEEIMNFGSKIELEVRTGPDGKQKKQSDKNSKSAKSAYSYVSQVDGKIMTHKTWDECKNRVHGTKGALYKKSTSKIDEEKIISEFKKK